MSMNKGWLKILAIKLIILVLCIASVTATGESGYLTYKEPAANSPATSLSTIAYVFSLLLTFAIIVSLAFFTSKFLSRRLPQTMQSRNMLIHDVVSLGTNKALYLVEINNRILLLGVSDQNITSLQEFTDEKFIAEIRAKGSSFSGPSPQTFHNVFQQQIETLQRMAGRISGGGKPD